jgi:hypothetical protein
MSITIDSMIDPLRRWAACQPPNRRPQVAARLTPQWNVAPGSRLIPRWTRLVVDKPLVVRHSSIRGDDRRGQPADEHPVIGARNRIQQCIDVGQMVSAEPRAITKMRPDIGHAGAGDVDEAFAAHADTPERMEFV